MKPKDLAFAVTVCVTVQQPVIIWGKPGIGKSQITAQIANAMNLELRDIRVSLLDAVDLRGLPTLADGKTKWAVPDFLPQAGNGILFLDELNRGSAMVQNACFQLILDRKLGEYTMPDGWSIVAACNESGTGITKISDALANRFVHLQAETDVENWCSWAVTADIEPIVIAFIRFRPDLLHQYDPKSHAYPTPRSWSFVSKITASNPNKDVEHGIYVGTVGEGAAIEYSSFVRLYRELPNIDALLLNPQSADVPMGQPAVLYALASALARKATVNNFSRILIYLDRMPEEFAVSSVKDATARDKSLEKTADFTRWCIKHNEVFTS